MSTKAEWDGLQDTGVAGMVGLILQQNRAESDNILNSIHDLDERRIVALEKENRILHNRLRNAQDKIASFFWDDSDEDWGP